MRVSVIYLLDLVSLRPPRGPLPAACPPPGGESGLGTQGPLQVKVECNYRARWGTISANRDSNLVLAFIQFQIDST